MRTEKETLERALEDIEKNKPEYDRYKGVIAGAYALWLGREKDVVDVENLSAFLKKHEPDSVIRQFVINELKDHWPLYRPLITRFDKGLLRQVALEHASPSCRRDLIGTPQTVTELVVQILDVAPNDQVVDLGAGLGAFLCRAYECVPKAHYIGYELLMDCFYIATMRAKLLGGDITIVQDNLLAADCPGQQFDKAFCAPARETWSDIDYLASGFVATLPPSFPKLKKNVSSGWIYAMKTLACLKEGGRGAIMLPVGGVSGKPDAAVRRYLLERGLIAAVVLLPGGLYDPFASTQMALVVLDKIENSEVVMIDATGMGARNRRGVELKNGDIMAIVDAMHGKPQKWATKVARSEIIASQDMNPAHYTQEKVKFQFPTRFGDVVKEVFRGKFVRSRMPDGKDDATPTAFQCLSVGNVNDGTIDENLPYLYQDCGREQRCLLRKNDIVLAKSSSPSKGDDGRRNDGARSKNGVFYKVAVADPAPGRPIVVNDTLLTIRLDEARADPWYVKAFLESEIGQTLLRRIAVGSSMQTLGIEAIKNMRIPLPPMEEQREIAARHREGMAAVLRLRRELNAAMRKRDDLANAFAALVTSPSAAGKETTTDDWLGK